MATGHAAVLAATHRAAYGDAARGRGGRPAALHTGTRAGDQGAR